MSYNNCKPDPLWVISCEKVKVCFLSPMKEYSFGQCQCKSLGLLKILNVKTLSYAEAGNRKWWNQ